MRSVAVRHRHCAPETTSAGVVGIAFAALVAACAGGSLPRPHYAQVLAEDYEPVPYAPRPPHVEIVPPRPAAAKGLVWADGGWEWSGERFRWSPGAWVVAPDGAKRARWVIVRRAIDGQLFFAPSSWRDASGRKLAPPTPLARAATRPRGPAGAGDVLAPGGVRTDVDE